ncbi:MAG: 5'-3' exonuclease [Gemmatimonadetes bacterium]|nr:5'-3' exonuclease [Gemmatimonadota bacterium]
MVRSVSSPPAPGTRTRTGPIGREVSGVIRGENPAGTVLLLDASSLLYRAFFAVPQSVTDREGRPVNAAHGYLDMTARLIGSRHPDETVHVHDHDWRPAQRVSAYSGYKSHRTEEPEALARQFELLWEVLEAFGFLQAEAPDWEAEDAIGALCAGLRESERAEIVTGDRDLIQLVRDPHVRVLFTVTGVSELRILDEAEVQARYGVPASRYADFAILRGDPSDGLPGVRGVGEKTARALVQAYPDLQALVADATAQRRTGPPLQRSPALRAAIRDAADYLTAMREVVPIRLDVEVRTWGGTRCDARLDELAEHHGLQSPVRRLRQALDPGDRGR